MIFDKIKRAFSSEGGDPEYIEIDLGKEVKKSKVLVRPFILKSYEDVNGILNALREGYTIGIVDIRPLRSKDLIELKRAISKIKKTADALEGSIAGFGENIIIVTPQFADIYKAPERKPTSKDRLLEED
ncbi:MAG TPA: cell division protein SepF [Bacteroidia bacterium]|nr:cell division protein SepF [Bacteroidia bacterium]